MRVRWNGKCVELDRFYALGTFARAGGGGCYNYITQQSKEYANRASQRTVYNIIMQTILFACGVDIRIYIRNVCITHARTHKSHYAPRPPSHTALRVS